MVDEVNNTDLLLGSVIQGRYLVVSRIGEGGSGMVYLVEHTRVGRRYALKVLDQTLARKPEILARFYREARAAAAVGDEHIVDIFDMGELDNGLPYMVMELLEGRDLASVLDRDGPMPIERAITVANQCCYALDTAHKKGIIHRDIKPKNIFLTQRRDGSEFIKILDFGISKILEAANDIKTGALTATGAVIGTPHYMSIEQIDGCSDIDGRTDVYAMGVVLFEMLTGRPPFDAPTYAKLVMKLVTDPPPSLVDMRADVPPGLEQVVHRALAKKREERFQSMAELVEALRPFAGLNEAPRLINPGVTGVTYHRPATPNGWEHQAQQNTLRERLSFVNARVFLASGFAGVAILGALYYFGFATRDTTTSTSAISLLRPAAPAIPPENRSVENGVTKTPPSEPASRPTPTSPVKPKDPSAKESDLAAARRSRQKVKRDEAYDKAARTGQRSREEKAQAALSQPEGQERKNSPTNPVARSSASPPGAATRTVTINNTLRTNVTVTVTCGKSSTSTPVTGLRHASMVVPKESCGVHCIGAGEPVCPPQLSADTIVFEIR